MNLSPFILSLLGNVTIALVIISFIFLVSLIRKRILGKMDLLVALSVGLILSIVFLGFLPEVFAHSQIPASQVGFWVLGGIFLFYILELFLHWHHCKDLSADGHAHHTHAHENYPLIALGVFFDNAIHGIVLFSAFSIDINFGIATTFAVLLHAIPQNVANLLMNGKDLRYVYLAAFGGIIGALLVFPFQEFLSYYNFHILSIIAGGLLYTSMSDILPSFKGQESTKYKAVYLLCMLAGILLFSFARQFTEHEEHIHEKAHHQEAHTQGDEHAHDDEIIENILQEAGRDYSVSPIDIHEDEEINHEYEYKNDDDDEHNH